MADKFGYEIRRIPAHYRELDVQARSAILQIKPYTMLPKVRLLSLYDQVTFLDRCAIEGGFVECGVWKGGAVALMALANLQHGGVRRHLHLFDVFQDICEPDATVDGALAIRQASCVKGGVTGRLVPLKGIYDGLGGHGTLEGNQYLLNKVVGYDSSYVHYHVGWFQDTIPKDAADVGPVALLRLDGDWYASTKICLEQFFDQIVPGGFIVIDDYGTYEGCRKAVDEFLQYRGIAAYLNMVDAGCCYFIK
jgi:O-methyltransferase